MEPERSYTGDVLPGGTPDVRTLDEAVITKRAVGALANNVYTVTCRSTGARLLVDAAADAPLLLAGLRGPRGPQGATSTRPRLDVLVTTHRHQDHLGALADVAEATSALLAAGRDDADAIEASTGVLVARRLVDGDTLTVGGLSLETVHLRGHTPGSVALALVEPADVTEPGAVAGRAHLFTGDALFPGGVGNTDRDPRRFTRLLDDVTTRLFDRFASDTVVYPGHGRDTTLGDERPHLPSWRARGW